MRPSQNIGGTCVTAPEAEPTVLRRKALEMICAQVSADAGMFYHLYEHDGAEYIGDVLLAGPGSADVFTEAMMGIPAPRGTVATVAGRGKWRKGLWDTRNPLERQRNRFARLDQDVEREAWMRTPTWSKFYGPSGLDDQLRALMYDGQTFVGWIGAFRQGRGERFEPADQDQLARIDEDVLALLSSASQLEAAVQDEVTSHAVVDARGRIEFASEVARAYLTGERLDAVARLVRGLDQSSEAASPYVFWEGVQLRVVRLDSDTGVRYLVVIDRAAIPGLSPLHALGDRQRQVGQYAAAGATTAEIARHLAISTDTVKYHIKRIYDALGIGSRAELANAWQRYANG